MGKTPKSPPEREALVLAVTIGELVSRHGVEYTVFVERPGRSGQFSRTWTNGAGLLAADQAEDLAAYVSRTVMDALVLWQAIQAVPAP